VSGRPRTLATLSPTRSTRPIRSSRGSALSWPSRPLARLIRSLTDSASVLIAIDFFGSSRQRVAPVEAEYCVREGDFGAGDERRIGSEVHSSFGSNSFCELFAPFRFFARVEWVSGPDLYRGLSQMRSERVPLLRRQM